MVFEYFKKNFFTPDPQGANPQLAGTTDCSNVLNQAILSLGTLTIANNHGSQKELTLARKRYGAALQSANNSLKDLDMAANEDTLSGILLLGMFEVR